MSLRKRRNRTIQVGNAASKEKKDEYRARTADRAIQSHPRYPAIIGAFREGLTPTKIGRWFAENGWLVGSETSFIASLQSFRRRHTELIASTDEVSLDSMQEANRPGLNFEVELDRLLRVQKERIAIDFKTEKSINKLFSSTHKEIQVAAGILDLMMKSKGIGNGHGIGNDTNFNADLPIEVRERLRGITIDETKRQTLFSLTQQFASKINDSKEKVSTT